MYNNSYTTSDINKDNNGSKKESFLSAKTAPPNIAIANCGAKPQGRPGIALYSDARKTNIKKESNVYLFNFIF